jgi:hypothetical protein
MIKNLQKRYFSPTPKNIRKIGDMILIGTASLSSAVMGLPLDDHTKLYIVFAFNVLGVIGKILTNFFKDEN